MTTTAIGASRVSSERRSGSEFVQSNECEAKAMMVANTGRVEERACDTCGARVKHAEVASVSPAGASFWHAEKHDAPCGRPCIGGGIGPEVIRPMRAAGQTLRDTVHGSVWCAACGGGV